MLVFEMTGTLQDLDVETSLLWEEGCLGLEEGKGTVRAYFQAPVELPLQGNWSETDDTDWVEKWKADLKPVRIGRFTIVPSWLKSDEFSTTTLVIDPGMAFGTGHHVTTQLAIDMLQGLDLQGKKVLDVGAGTGLLALVSARCGADAWGVDLDPLTVPIARQNALDNHVDAHFYEGTLQDMFDHKPFDVLVCNLYAELHVLLAHDYAEFLCAGGTLILTGILSERFAPVREALIEQGFQLSVVRESGEWLVCTASR
mgnify:CR=1 FL=1